MLASIRLRVEGNPGRVGHATLIRCRVSRSYHLRRFCCVIVHRLSKTPVQSGWWAKRRMVDSVSSFAS